MLILTPGHATLKELEQVYRGQVPVRLDPSCHDAIALAAARIAKAVAGTDPVYGVNTGFGKLASVKIAARDTATLQRNLILSHCSGVGEATPRAITRLGLCRSFQVPQVFLSETVFDNTMVAYGIAEENGFGLLAPVHTAAREAHVDAHLRRYQIFDYREFAASALPQGVRKLLDIAMATVRQPKLVMLDEPTSGISVDEKFGLMDIIMEALRQEQTTVLFIEHDMEIVERYVARVLAFSLGEIICDAPTAEAMKHPKVMELIIGDKKSSDNGADGHA